MANVKICHSNYLNSDLVIDLSSSSELPSNPVSNLFLSNRRSQTWRTQGSFEVTSANKAIVFKESNSGSLTANIAEATYSSDSSFLAAVKSALEAVGDSTYLVSRASDTNLINISSNGSGGDGIFSILWTSAGATADDLLGFSNAADDTGSLNYTSDYVRIHTSEWVRWDLGLISNPKGFIIHPKANDQIGISNSAIIRLQANNSDSWSSPAVDINLTHHDESIYYFDSSGIGGYRYWRLYIEDKDNANGYLEISKAFLGDIIEPEQGSIQFPLGQKFIDLAQNSSSQMGVRFTSERQQVEELTFDWFGLSIADYEAIKSFIKSVGTGTPFFVSLDPGQVFSSNLATYIKLLHFDELPTHDLVSPRIWTGSWTVREAA